MRSKQEIENQLAHFTGGECHQHDSAENRVWIEALGWVLGDEAHRASYDQVIATLVEATEEPAHPDHLRLCLRIAVERLR